MKIEIELCERCQSVRIYRTNDGWFDLWRIECPHHAEMDITLKRALERWNFAMKEEGNGSD